MYIGVFKNNGTEYLQLMNSRRVENDQGQKVVKKQVVLNIGPLSRFDDGQPNYLERLRESFRQGEPLIASLRPYIQESKEQPEARDCSVVFHEGTEDCIGHPKRVANVLLERIFTELGLTHLLAQIKSSSKIEYDLLGLTRLLVFGRLLDPASKIATIEQNNDYYPPPTICTNPYQVYDVLDVIHKNKGKIIRSMNAAITKNLNRNPQVVFYDVTNFFFEIEDADEDQEQDGEIVKGLRKKGVSKEHRPTPIVQMGLFMDDKGLPVSMEIFPGNTLDQATLRPALKATLNGLDFKRFILVADRGLCSHKNNLYLMQNGHGYIVSKSIAKTVKEERLWILEQDEYQSKGENFKYKSRIVTRHEKDENGRICEFREKVVVYWSRSFYERERHEHKAFLEFVEKLKENPASFRITATQKKSMERFFKKEYAHAETGEIVDGSKLLAILDTEKLEAFTAYMGYYQIVSSEIDMDDSEIIDKYHGLSQIEDQFRVMKGDLASRPMFVRTPEHIDAHLTICLIALTILRLIQRRILDSGLSVRPREREWSNGLTGERVQTALRKWQVEALPQSYFRFCNTDDPDLKLVLDAYAISIPAALFSAGDLRSLKASFDVF